MKSTWLRVPGCLLAAVLIAVPAGAQKKASTKSRGASLAEIEQMQFPTINLGTISGALTSSDLVRSDETYADGFSYMGRAGEVITVTMRSSDLDSWLVIDDPNGPLDEYNDDGAGGNDAELTITLPHAGRYIILANTVSKGVTGSYTLTVASGGSSGVIARNTSSTNVLSMADIGRLPLPRINMGQTIDGTLSPTDILRDDSTYTDGFIYQGRAGEQITVTMRSSDFDAWLVVDDPNGPLHEHNDDGAGGTDAMLTVTLPHDGSYIILANVVQKRTTGRYTLTLTYR